VKVPKALLLLKAPKPPLVGSRVAGEELEGEPKICLVALPSADVDPKAGFERPCTDGLPKTDVVESDFEGVVVGVNDPDEEVKTDICLVPISFGGL
jgi:hypothetical protein